MINLVKLEYMCQQANLLIHFKKKLGYCACYILVSSQDKMPWEILKVQILAFAIDQNMINKIRIFFFKKRCVVITVMAQTEVILCQQPI